MRRTPIVWCAASLLPCVVLAFSDEPQGFGEVRFGSSREQVRAAYSDAAEPERGPELYAALPEVTFLQRNGASLSGLIDPVNVTFVFHKDRLWVVRVDLGANDPRRAMELLKERHGEPTSGGRSPIWSGERTAIVMYPVAGYYEVAGLEFAPETGAVFPTPQVHDHAGDEKDQH